MEHIPEILRVMAELGLSPLNLVLLALVYFMAAKSGFVPKFWKERKEEKAEDMPHWAQTLIGHFNHDTTSHHEMTHQKLDTIIQQNKDSKSDHERTKETINAIKNSVENLDKYGMKVRGRQN